MEQINFSKKWIGYLATDRILAGTYAWEVPELVGQRLTLLVTTAVWNQIANPLLRGIDENGQ